MITRAQAEALLTLAESLEACERLGVEIQVSGRDSGIGSRLRLPDIRAVWRLFGPYRFLSVDRQMRSSIRRFSSTHKD
jgi:hypothetical protein